MKKTNFKRLLKVKSLLIGVSLSSLILAACSNTGYDPELIFSIAQSSVYPMAIALTKIVPLYNEQQKNTENFLPVKLLTTKENNLNSEFGLLNDTITKITGNDKQTPSLILNSAASAATINSYQRLLNVSDILKPEDFAPELNQLYTTVVGSNDTSRLYAIPYNVSTTESLAINLPVLKFLIDQATYHGATVSEPVTNSSGVLKQLKSTTTEQAKTKIAQTVWNRYEYKDGTNADATKKLTGLTINEDTFTHYDKLTEFTKKIVDVLTLKTGETVSKDSKYANVLSIDYSSSVFSRRLWEETGSQINDYIWKYLPKAENNKSNIVDYTFLKDETKAQQFTKAFDAFIAYYETPNVAKKLRNIFFTKNTNDWASWLLRTADTAIAIAPNVGVRQSVQSQLSKLFFATKDKQVNQTLFNSFAELDKDVFWFNQFTKTSTPSTNEQQLQTYVAGGSSLVPISINETKDLALKKFLNWIYKGQLENGMKVSDFIEQESSYFIPLKDKFGDEAKVQKQIEFYKSKQTNLTDNDQNSDVKFLNRSLQLSAEDYLLFLQAQKAAPYNLENSNKQVLFNDASDINTLKLSSEISSQIKSLGDEGAKKITGNELLAKLKEENLSQ
ncbi:hypothetical protein J2Z62_000685 [Mycoplasmoides fastidiosum]|uniref:Mycoplasma lipoprotein C-terminal domain-containing protein n=1 Tax=Mycoplasmoides fastidiosum TaxID=92758 RepID=A0ABU0LZY0_9BACT|nr:hypothetical protein [Mycoplasmoides fastidiosum]MDQ0514247.1 hypothetical protein [Mycoplasmoides fastidiosum]UUD37345.1 hypothetical protein NPA10_02050 [Mycoplasmoides fastidiosum]